MKSCSGQLFELLPDPWTNNRHPGKLKLKTEIS